MSRVIMGALGLSVALVLSGARVHGDVKFLSTFKSMNAGAVSFFGKKVAAVIVTNDDSLRISGEEALARELTARGLEGVATYRIAPKEELQKAETAKVWFERAGVEGVVVLRPVSAAQRTTYNPGTWVTPYYNSLWGYWGNSWGSVYIPGRSQRQTVVIVESIIYSVPTNELLWAAATESPAERNLQDFIEELVKESVKQLHEQGLARRIAR
jgi:hypothetical protein